MTCRIKSCSLRLRISLHGMLAVLLSALSLCQTFGAAAKVDFNFQIRPLLSDRCFRCHGPDSSARKAKLRLDTLEGSRKELEDGWAVIKPGDVEKSELVRRIYTTNEDDVMPPPDSHLTLSVAEKGVLKRLVAEGCEVKQHWGVLPGRKGAVTKHT